MKYKTYPKVENAHFTCVEELKVDMIENILRFVAMKFIKQPSCYIEIITTRETAEQLYTKLLQADVNGFYFHLSEDDNDISVSKCFADNDVIVLSIFNDGDVIIESDKYFDTSESEFTYIDNKVDKKYINGLNNGFRDILICDIDY